MHSFEPKLLRDGRPLQYSLREATVSGHLAVLLYNSASSEALDKARSFSR